jgi:hypothetical protein
LQKGRFTDKERDMTTLVVDRQTLPEKIMSLIGDAPRILVSQGKYGDRDIVLSPAAEDDEPGVEYIDPADYEDETAYINAIPGLTERLLAYRNLPASEFEEVPEEYFNA